MREILFRGFHKCEDENKKIFIYGKWVKGKWVEGYLVNDEISCISAIITYANLSGDMSDLSEVNICRVIPETIGQYTGLTDKNGKKIFEGDVCVVSLKYFNINDEKTKVIFKNGCFCFQFGFSDDYVKTHDAWDAKSIKVIGNIFENPELLKGE